MADPEGEHWFTVDGGADGSFLYDGSIHETFVGSGLTPTDINNKGVTVGFIGGGIDSGFVSTDGVTYTTLSDPLGVNGTIVSAINDAGVIVGTYYDSNFFAHGFYYDGAFHTIDDPQTVFSQGGTGENVMGINNHGQIVGWFTDKTGFASVKSFIYENGTFVTLDDPGIAGTTVADGINDSGQIVGSFKSGSSYHGFLADPGTKGVLEFVAASSTNVSFGHGGTLILDTATNAANKFTGKISGFDHSDDIVLGAINFDAVTTTITQSFANANGGTVTVTDALHHSITLNFVDDYRSEMFQIHDDHTANRHVDLLLP